MNPPMCLWCTAQFIHNVCFLYSQFISVVGEIVSELIGKGQTRHDISLFSLATNKDGSLVRDKKKEKKAVLQAKGKPTQRSKL